MAMFYFQNGGCLPSWFLKSQNFILADWMQRVKLPSMQYFIRIGRTVFEIIIFITFQDGNGHHLGF